MASRVSKAGRPHASAGAVSGRGRNAPGRGGSHLDAVGPDRSALDLGGFNFDTAIAPGGYRWLYADAVSEDGRFSLVLIALVGSVFSPYYAWAGRKAPIDHCALNVCLYGPRARRWAMTERRAKAVDLSGDHMRIGPSSVRFEDGALIYEIHEHGAPIPYPVRGRVTIRPQVEQGETFTLDGAGRHVWRPRWPRARVEAQFQAPDLSWSGDGYVDMNAGIEPLEAGFTYWDWSRAATREGAAILYDSLRQDGTREPLALDIGKDGTARRFEAPEPVALPITGWRVGRGARSEGSARVVETLEDTPFYSRSLIETELLGAPRLSMHESLDLTRFSSSWVKVLLPFRMPRAF